MEEIKKIIKDFIDSDVVVEVPDYALISLYGAMRSLFYKFDKMVTDIGFELLIPEEGEQRDIYKQRNALDDFCAALRRQIKFHQRNREVMEQMMFQTQHDPNFDDVDPEQKAQAMAMHHCGQDASRLVAYGDNLEQIIGARVRLFHTPGHKCEECPYRVKSDGSSCKYHKVELISGHFICLTPNPIITE